MPLRGSSLPLLLLVLASGCRTTPASILLRIEAGAGLTAPEELRLTILGAAGVEVRDQRLPASGAPTLPNDVVLFPPRTGGLRLLCRAMTAAAPIGEGYAPVTAVAGEQVRATLVIGGGQLPDGDGDGFPDAVDSCPGRYKPDQAPCAGDGGTGEGLLPDLPDLGPIDRTYDIKPSGPDLLDCDKDRDGWNAAATCGGLDCDDANPALKPGQPEGPTGSPTCSDGLDNDCDGQKDAQDVGCKSCTKNPDCHDPNACVKTSCVGGRCQVTPVSDGTYCDDGKHCTDGDSCKSGLCNPGKPRLCAAQACKSNPTCNETTNTCDYTLFPSGTTCDDANPCTQGETCSSTGTCTSPPILLETVQVADIAYSSDRTLRLDAAGKLHVVFTVIGITPETLRHGTNASGSWVLETIDPGDLAWPAMALDGQGQVHVLYRNVVSTVYTMVHAVRSSLAFDASGDLHAVYARGGKLRYARRASGTWSAGQDIDDLGVVGTSVGLMTSLAVDGNGKLHVAHGSGTAWEGGVQSLRYTTNASGSWATTTPASSLGTSHGGFPSLAVDASGNIFISHSSTTDTTALAATLRLTSRVGGTWNTETVGTGVFSSLVLSPTKASPTIGFRDPAAAQIKVAMRGTTGWTLVTVDASTGQTGGWVSLAQETIGRAHLVYETHTGPAVKHAALGACP